MFVDGKSFAAIERNLLILTMIETLLRMKSTTQLSLKTLIAKLHMAMKNHMEALLGCLEIDFEISILKHDKKRDMKLTSEFSFLTDLCDALDATHHDLWALIIW